MAFNRAVAGRCPYQWLFRLLGGCIGEWGEVSALCSRDAARLLRLARLVRRRRAALGTSRGRCRCRRLFHGLLDEKSTYGRGRSVGGTIDLGEGWCHTIAAGWPVAFTAGAWRIPHSSCLHPRITSPQPRPRMIHTGDGRCVSHKSATCSPKDEAGREALARCQPRMAREAAEVQWKGRGGRKGSRCQPPVTLMVVIKVY